MMINNKGFHIFGIILLICTAISPNLIAAQENANIVAIGPYVDKSKGDGYQILTRNGKITAVISIENSRPKQFIQFKEYFPNLGYILDSVGDLNKRVFSEIYDLWMQMSSKGYFIHGMVQYHIREYDENGFLEQQGWACSFVEEDNDFEFEKDPLEIGVWTIYKEGVKVKVVDKTAGTIDIMRNMLKAIENGDPQFLE